MTSDPKPGRLSMPHRIAEVLVQATRPDADPRTVARRLRAIADWLDAGAPPKAPRAARDPVAVTEEVREVFDYWHRVFKRNAGTQLSDERAKMIAARLAKMSVARCKLAIDGLKASSFHSGQNDRNTKYQEIRHVFGDDDTAEGFANNAPKRQDWLKPEVKKEVKEDEKPADEATRKAKAAELLQALAGVGRRVM